MSPKKANYRRTSAAVYRAERDAPVLLQRVQEIRALADGEKEALGFLPEAAYSDAITHGRLVAMIAQIGDSSELAGFILFSGVFPNARVQQIVVSPNHRRGHVASALINEVISQLETQGYLTITAAVASDLPIAQAFYERNRFVARHSRQGGSARGRTIVLRARDLDTASFFSMLEPPTASASSAIDLGLMQRSAGHAPLYVIDLNVLFDLVKDRTRATLANRLFGAALAHQIRLAVAPEFLVELGRTTTDSGNDPILKLARQLPRLPTTDRSESDRLCGIVHHLIFGEQSSVTANSPQSKSDVRHIAQAALARASGYVTSDGRVLASRQRLLAQVGIDVASLDDFVTLLPAETPMLNTPHLKGANFDIKPLAPDAVARYLSEHKLPQKMISEFAPSNAPAEGRIKARGIIEAGEVIGVGVCITPEKIDAPARILIHVRTDHVSCETYVDHLVDIECWEACEKAPTTIELPELAGQTAVRRTARLRGFLPVGSGDTRIKVALGRPVTFENWPSLARQTRGRTGLRLPEAAPDANAVQSGLMVQGPDGKQVRIRLTALEDALGPTILMWPGRDGVIIPITKSYADDLLGTGAQIPLFGSPEAAFVARRTYFNTPRAAGLMRPGSPILFYESRRSGGQGVVAAARIVDTVAVPKGQVPDELLRRAVVEEVDSLSSSPDVLATTFDNLLRFPYPVSLERLRELDAVGPSNLQTTTALPSIILSTILDLGWTRGGRN